MTQFVILAAPRTGSNLLCTLLNSHSKITCHHELFNPNGVFWASDFRERDRSDSAIRQRDRDLMRFLRRVWTTAPPDCGAVGFKWTRGQSDQVLQTVLSDPHIAKIVLRRRNRIKTYVSERIARQTDQWEVYSGDELMMPRPRVRIDLEQLRDHMAINDRFYADLMSRLSAGDQPHEVVDYECLFDQPTQARLLRLLHVPPDPLPLAAASVKQNSSDLRDTIANFAELAESLSDPDLIAELHDRRL